MKPKAERIVYHMQELKILMNRHNVTELEFNLVIENKKLVRRLHSSTVQALRKHYNILKNLV